MSGTLCFRKTPSKWNGYFELPLRDKIYDHVGGYNNIDYSSLPYFTGLRDASENKDDIENLNKIIKILEDGDTIDFKMEY